MPEIVVYALGGRSVAQKRALVEDITDAAVTHLNVDTTTVTVSIVETLPENKARGGVLFSDLSTAQI
jgi:4-oxalocrotonate tautomerase